MEARLHSNLILHESLIRQVKPTTVNRLLSLIQCVEDRSFAVAAPAFCRLTSLLLPVECMPQTLRLLVSDPAVSCAAASIFLQLYLYPAVHSSFSRSLLQAFFQWSPSICSPVVSTVMRI